MAYETLRLARNILFRIFWVGLAFAMLYGVVTFTWSDLWTRLIVEEWRMVNRETLGVLTLTWFSIMRFFLFFLVLTPAIALHWTLRRLEKGRQ